MKRLRGSRLAGVATFVVLVALVIAAPIAVLGEVSSTDARDRLQRDEIASAADAADRAADLLRSRLTAVLDEVAGIVKNDEFGGAIDATDYITAGALLERYKSVTSSDIDRLFVIRGCTDCQLSSLFVNISVPTDERLGQPRPASDYLIPKTASGSGPSSGDAYLNVTSNQRIFVASHPQGPPTIAVAMSRRPAGLLVLTKNSSSNTGSQNSVVADIPVSHLEDWLLPLAGPGQRIFVLDDSYRQIAAVAEGNAIAQSMGGPVLDAVRGKDHFAARLADGRSDAHTIASALVTSSGSHVIVVRPASTPRSS